MFQKLSVKRCTTRPLALEENKKHELTMETSGPDRYRSGLCTFSSTYTRSGNQTCLEFEMSAGKSGAGFQEVGVIVRLVNPSG